MWLRVKVRGALEQWKGELILSRGEGGWERKTYHGSEASTSADWRTKQMRRGAVRRIPPRGRASSTPACSAPACSTPGTSSAGEALGGGHPRQCFDAGGQGGTAMRQNGGISEGGCGGEAEWTKQKATQLCFEKKGKWGCGQFGAMACG